MQERPGGVGDAAPDRDIHRDGPEDGEGSSVCRVEGDIGGYEGTLGYLHLPHGVKAPAEHCAARVRHPLRVDVG